MTINQITLSNKIYYHIWMPPLCFSYSPDPREWNETAVEHWLSWAIREFSLEGVKLQQFCMRGKDICAMGKEAFLARAPPFMGDILWEHLEILQKGKCKM